MARYTGPKQELHVNLVKQSLEQIKFYLRKTILPDSMEITAVEKLLNTVSCWLKSRKQNILTEYWKNNSVACLKRLQE